MAKWLFMAGAFLFSHYGQQQAVLDKIIRLAEHFPDSTQVAIGITDRGKRAYIGFIKTNNQLLWIKNAERVFGIASITKLFTSTLVADLVNHKQISLNDELQRFYPFNIHYSGQAGPVTILGLCTHSSGLPADMNTDVERYLKAGVQLSFDGGQYRYSNLGFMILSDVVERCQHKNYATMLHEKILRPLKMNATSIDLKNLKPGQLVEARNANGKKMPVRTSFAYEGVGAIKSTVKDMLNFLEYSFMKRSTIRQNLWLTQQKYFRKSENESIGLGWHILQAANNESVYYHHGWLEGYTAHIRYSTRSQRGIVVLSNLSGYSAYKDHIPMIAEAYMEMN